MIVQARSLFFVAATAFSLTALHSPAARAEGSGGTGGSAGERDNFPCTGCVTLAPTGYSEAAPMPVVVTFHGDEGNPGYIHDAFASSSVAKDHIVLSLQCPSDVGCGDVDGSWWRWFSTDPHDPNWLGEQIDALEAEYNIERNQIYLAGFSGGAEYVSWASSYYADRYAGVIFLGGGGTWIMKGDCTEECQIPSYYINGADDFLHDASKEVHDYYEGCGYETNWDPVPDTGHEIVYNKIDDAVSWVMERPHQCREGSDPVSNTDDEVGDVDNVDNLDNVAVGDPDAVNVNNPPLIMIDNVDGSESDSDDDRDDRGCSVTSVSKDASTNLTNTALLSMFGLAALGFMRRRRSLA